MPVYDANGRLVGTVDPAALNALAPLPGSAQDDGVEQAAQRVVGKLGPTTIGQDGQSTGARPGVDHDAGELEEITKALGSARFNTTFARDGLVAVAKASGNGDPFDVVLKHVDSVTAGRLTDAVALVALRLATRHNLSVARAVNIAKQAAVKIANTRAKATPRSDTDVIRELARRLAK
jgi:hypothetical protein